MQKACKSYISKVYNDFIIRNLGSPTARNSHIKINLNRYRVIYIGDGYPILILQKYEVGKLFYTTSTNASKKRTSKIVGNNSISEVIDITNMDLSYKELYKTNLFKYAYEIIKSKPGNITPGPNNKTLDGVSND